MQELIKITSRAGQNVVSAKELHQILGSLKGFSGWIAKSLQGYEDGTDFEILSQKGQKGAGRPTIDYALTLDVAKHVAMMSRTAKSKEIRQYFIDCEKRLQNPTKTQIDILVENALALQAQERKMLALEAEVVVVKAEMEVMKTDVDVLAHTIVNQVHPLNYFTVAGYYAQRGKPAPHNNVLKQLGKQVTQASKASGVSVNKAPHERYGNVNVYRDDMLAQVLGF